MLLICSDISRQHKHASQDLPKQDFDRFVKQADEARLAERFDDASRSMARL